MRVKNSFWLSQSVVVTGASSGIGKALAEYLVAQGAKVGLIARRQERLEQLSETLAAPDGQVAWATADVKDREAIAEAAETLEKQLGPCDVMIANAGVYRKTDVTQFDADAANDVVATNVQGVMNSVGAVLPGMIERQKGHLVAVSSIAAMIGMPGAGAYCASKAALVTLFESLRVDLYPYGVKATVVGPGFVDTPMITDEERETVKDLVTAEQAAIRICRAIQRDRAVDWFPWQTWLPCRLLSLAPSGLYRRLISLFPEMEETDTK